MRTDQRSGLRRRSGASQALVKAAVTVAAVASLLAPAAAAEEVKPGDDNEAEPSHATGQSACVGDATAEQGFVDVPAGHYARPAINCLAYYRITSGTGDGTTFSPDAVVTADQMRGFMEAAARVAGADRAAVLVDFDATGDAAVTRGEAAALVVRLLVAATGRNSLRNIEFDDGGDLMIDRKRPDDWFADSRAAQPRRIDGAVSALYELGVARGRADGSFGPDEPLTRGAAAVFITRALAYTRVRPEGVTIQQNVPGEVVVSVRDSDFAPLVNVPIDVFSVSTRLVGSTAFKSDGTCGSVEVPAGGHSGSKCAIHSSDPVSDSGGDLLWLIDVDDRGGTTVWAWTGEEGDRVADRARGLARVDLTELKEVVATGAKVTHDLAEEARKAHFGTTVTVTLQLVGAGNKDAVPPAGGASYRVAVSTWRGLDGTPAPESGSPYNRYSFTESVDGSGKLTFELTAEDPDPEDTGDTGDTGDGSTDEVRVSYTITNAAGNRLPAPTGASCSSSDTGPSTVPRCPVFSDEKPTIRKVEVTTPTKQASPPASGGEASNVAIIAVTDQYGDPISNVGVLLTSSIADEAAAAGDTEERVELVRVPRVTLRDGRVRLPYLYKSSRTAVEELGVQLPGPDRRFGDDPDTDADESADDIELSTSPDEPPYLETATFFWLKEPTHTEFGQDDNQDGGACVLSSSVSENTMIVDTNPAVGVEAPANISYSLNDHLYLNTMPVKLATFKDRLAKWEQDLADGTVEPDNKKFRLGWQRNSSEGITRWLLTENPTTPC